MLAQYQELCNGLCKRPLKRPSDFLSKENCVRGALNQGLDSPAEGSRAGLAEPQRPKLILTLEHSGREQK